MNARELLNALDAFEQEKGRSKEIVIDALKEAIDEFGLTDLYNTYLNETQGE